MALDNRFDRYESDFSREAPTAEGPYIGYTSRIAIICVFGTIIGTVVSFVAFPSRTATVSIDSPPALDSKPIVTNLAHSVEPINFSLRRSGYKALPYFDWTEQKTSYFNYKILTPYNAIVEPYSAMEFHAYNDVSTATYKFEVCSTNSEKMATQQVECQTGESAGGKSSTVSFGCSTGDELTIKVSQYGADKMFVQTATGKAICKYVRREMRDLSETDLNAYLDAAKVVYTVEEEEGRLKYGSNYHSNSYLHKFHFFNAAWQDADHIHKGNGFLAQHLKFTNIFEMSIQAVNPAVCLPYWDFTIDEAEGKTMPESFVMSADVFGSMHYSTDKQTYKYGNDKILDGRILDGRWKEATVSMNTDFPELLSGFGYMRSPWNFNPSPYVSRFTLSDTYFTLPTCESHYETLYDTDLMDFMYDMESRPHGTAHLSSGGIFGLDQTESLVEKGFLSESGAETFFRGFYSTLGYMYRRNIIVPEDNCSVNENSLESSECGYVCKDTSLLIPVTQCLYEGQSTFDYSQPGLQAALEEFYCGGPAKKILLGDQVEAASPADPAFWTMHPVLDRLLHAKCMAGGFETTGWATDPQTDFVCVDSECYISETDSYGFSESCCMGHYENSQLLNAPDNDRFSGYGITNGDLVKQIDPTTDDYAMTYVYDSFSWDHCTATGSDFSALFDELVEASKSGAPRPMSRHQKAIRAEKANLLAKSKKLGEIMRNAKERRAATAQVDHKMKDVAQRKRAN